MAITGPIPLPGIGGDALSSGINTMLKNLMEQRKLAETAEHNKQLMEYHKQALAQAGANKGLQRQLLQEQILHAKHSNDPLWQLNAFQQAYNAAASRMPGAQGGMGGGQQNTAMPGAPQGVQPPSKQDLMAGLMGGQQMPQGQGALSPEAMGMPNEMQEQPDMQQQGMQQPAEQPAQPQTIGGFDPRVFEAFPALRGMYKKATGYDPMEEYKASSFTGPAREGLDLARLKKDFGENSVEYQNAKAINDSKLRQREDLSTLRDRQINGLKPGDTKIIDPQTGQTIGFRKQTTDKQKDAAKNKVLFNHLYPLVYNGAAMFSGPGATMKLEQAAREYKTNPIAKKLIDDFLVAEKAATTTAVTEAARFGAGRTNQTFNRFVETLKAEDIPAKLKKWIKEYEVPASANLDAAKRWQKELNAAESKATKQIPATYDYYFDPEKQFANQQAQEDMGNESTGNKSNRLKFNIETGRLE